MKDFIGSIVAGLLFLGGSTTPEMISAPDLVTWTLQNLAFLATITVAVVTIIRKTRNNGQKATKRAD